MRRMSFPARIFAILAVATLGACGGGDKSTAPQKGTLVVKIDAQSCTGTGSVTVFIDGTSQPAKTMSAGDSQSFTVDAGQHSVGASTSTFSWPSQVVTVPANASYTALLTC